MSTAEDITLTAADGYPLAATWHRPATPAKDSQGRDTFVAVGAATGVPRGFYKRFAQYANSRGLHVLCTDYRGIGGSKHRPLRGFDMQYADWSTLDLAAAVRHCAERGSCYIVGHSLGGHALGQLPDLSAVKAALVCGSGAGWHGHMPGLERHKVWFLWHVLGPIMTRWHGYHPMSKLGMGEDLPMGVYRDWKRWCQLPHYFFDDPAAQHIAKRFAQVRFPVAAWTSTDDLWAPPASRDAFFKGFTATAVHKLDLDPQALGAGPIGHMGYFRQGVGTVLWPQMLAWLAAQGMPLHATA